MQKELQKKQYDTIKKCENLESKLKSLLEAIDILDFFDKSLEFLTVFKSIIDNNPKIKQNLKTNKCVSYVIRLRNYQQHHENDYQKTIENNSATIFPENTIMIDSTSSIYAGKIICNGKSASNFNMVDGRVISSENDQLLDRKFYITKPFNFSYNHQNRPFNGYEKKPPANGFYQILESATKELVLQMKEIS